MHFHFLCDCVNFNKESNRIADNRSATLVDQLPLLQARLYLDWAC